MAQALSSLTNVQVPVQGISQATANAISQATGIAVGQVVQVLGSLTDLMLPNMVPGQVPQALSQLTTAVSTLESQVDPIIQAIRTQGGMATGNQVSAIANLIGDVEVQVTNLATELAQADLPALQAEADLTKAETGANTTAISGIDQVLPTLATSAQVTVLAGTVGIVENQLALAAPSALGAEVTSVSTVAQEALRLATDADECCSVQTQNLQDDENALGGKSNLPNLGKLAGLLFGITWLAGLVDAVVAVFDLPAAFAAEVSDVKTLASWADAAANQAVLDTSWSKMVAG